VPDPELPLEHQVVCTPGPDGQPVLTLPVVTLGQIFAYENAIVAAEDVLPFVRCFLRYALKNPATDRAACQAELDRLEAIGAAEADEDDEDIEPGPEDFDELESLRGYFIEGYTAEDVTYVLDRMSGWTGLDLVFRWLRYDESGPCGGGNVFARRGETLHAAPAPLLRYLFGRDDGRADYTIRLHDLVGLAPGPPAWPVPDIQLGRNLCVEDVR
jgi:hypothetical protein